MSESDGLQKQFKPAQAISEAGFGGFGGIIEVTGDHAVLTLRGEVDAVTEGPLRRLLDDAAGSDRSHVMVDIAAVSFMDSAGVRALAEASKGLSARGADLAIRSPSPMVSRLLGILGHSALVAV